MWCTPQGYELPQTITEGFLNWRSLFSKKQSRHVALAEVQVVPEPSRCVQCGICSYSCPIGIDVRAHAWAGEKINDSHCISCGECIARCPRDVLLFEKTNIFPSE
jgi:ferredoxin